LALDEDDVLTLNALNDTRGFTQRPGIELVPEKPHLMVNLISLCQPRRSDHLSNVPSTLSLCWKNHFSVTMLALSGHCTNSQVSLNSKASYSSSIAWRQFWSARASQMDRGISESCYMDRAVADGREVVVPVGWVTRRRWRSYTWPNALGQARRSSCCGEGGSANTCRGAGGSASTLRGRVCYTGAPGVAKEVVHGTGVAVDGRRDHVWCRRHRRGAHQRGSHLGPFFSRFRSSLNSGGAT
jgi:hypothetical protein